MSQPPLRAAIIPVTPLQQNCSLIWCTETMLGALVDPGGDLPKLKAAVAHHGATRPSPSVTMDGTAPKARAYGAHDSTVAFSRAL